MQCFINALQRVMITHWRDLIVNNPCCLSLKKSISLYNEQTLGNLSPQTPFPWAHEHSCSTPVRSDLRFSVDLFHIYSLVARPCFYTYVTQPPWIAHSQGFLLFPSQIHEALIISIVPPFTRTFSSRLTWSFLLHIQTSSCLVFISPR